jgi:hypothetical protein
MGYADNPPGTPPGQTPDDAKHYVKCEKCGAWIDTRNLEQCLDHEGRHELPPDLRQH